MIPRWMILWILLGSTVPGETDSSERLLHTSPPEWELTKWINSDPLRIADLKGKVVLVRWWTAPQCSYCRATAPALNEFYDRYRSQGLELIGVYHHKSSKPLQTADVEAYTREYGFKFPVAIDVDWKSLKQWWLDRVDSGWTSVSFLLDKTGKIRLIHPGGQYVRGDDDYKAMQKKIEELLAEK